MNRTSATTWLAERYRELVTYAKFTSQNTTDAYNGALDMALRQLGYAESALSTADVPDSSVLKYLALLRYYALDRFATLLTVQFDVEAGQGAIKATRSQAYKAVLSEKSQAAAELTQYGINVGSVESFQMGRVTLDFLEPSAARSEF